MDLQAIETFLRENALHWGMILLYVWIIFCASFFFWRYMRSVEQTKSKSQKNYHKFVPLIDRLKEIDALLMQSDQNAEEGQRMLEEIETEGRQVMNQFGVNKSYEHYLEEIRLRLDQAQKRLNIKESGQQRVQENFKRQHMGQNSSAEMDE